MASWYPLFCGSPGYAELRPALDKIRHWHASDELPLLKLPARRDDLAALKPHLHPESEH